MRGLSREELINNIQDPVTKQDVYLYNILMELKKISKLLDKSDDVKKVKNEVNLENMTKKELVEFAKKNNINVDKRKNKSNIINEIKSQMKG